MKKISLILALILIIASIGCVPTGIAFAASETIYTGVLEDLQKDKTFDVSNYPSKDKLSDEDKVMDVIQIAESNAGELFLYVYQPQASKYTATEVRISQTVGDNLDVKDRKLTLLSREGTLEKYKVEELQVKADAVRYYLVVQLARPWDKLLDNGNTAKNVVYGIDRLFTAETIDAEVSYTVKQAKSLLIDNKYVGNIRYYTGGTWGQVNYSSVHYVAFSSNIRIDDIYEVDITYDMQDYKLVDNYAYNNWSDEYRNNGFFTDRQPPKTNEKTLKSQQYESFKNPWDFLLNKTHTWNTIERSEIFVSKENLSPDVEKKLLDTQWVLRFATTNITRTNMGIGVSNYNFSEVTNVSILRLNFLSNGRVYNLSVIDNKQTGGSITKPDNPGDNSDPLFGLELLLKRMESLWDKIVNAFKWLGEHWWVIIAGLAAIALIAGLIIAIVKEGAAVVFKVIGKVLWWIFKIIFYIVTLPVWLIIWGVRAIKKGRDGNG